VEIISHDDKERGKAIMKNDHPYGGLPRVLKKEYRAQSAGSGGRSTSLVLHPDTGIRPKDRVRVEIFPDGSVRLVKSGKPKKKRVKG
jgi:hypothetical protein